jgi:D-sedoheptulose 7-phosphate isomerase
MTGAPRTLDDRALHDAVLRKSRQSAEAQHQFFETQGAQVVACARAMARAFTSGARLFTFGNGGSACDAEHMAVEFAHPIVEKRRALPALALGSGRALLTAIGNDQDFALAYARELTAHARSGDIAVGISTSGKSRNVVRALKAARELNMLRVGLTGRDGGQLAPECDFAFVVDSFSIHRIQEVHGALLHVLWDLVHVALGEEDVL